jgi:predicted DNA-binding protein with PD1-like motif
MFSRGTQMNAKHLEPETWALVFDKGDEPISLLERFAKEQRLTAASFSAIGAFSSAVLGYFDREQKQYEEIEIAEQVEVLSLLGDIAVHEGEPKIHAHVVVGKRDGTALGGHLLRAQVWPTLELVLRESPAKLRKRHDPETGLALIDPLL